MDRSSIIKKDPTTKNIPVIFLTAMTEAQDEAKGLALGAVDYITKPFNEEILKREKLAMEYEALKNQVNPHFFFNTLNNLYGLTVEKSDDAPNVVLKLSDMMRYTIYMSNTRSNHPW